MDRTGDGTGHADVAIIGAGVHGAAAAYHLAADGARVVVFEKGAPAGGPTGYSSGICRAYYTNLFLAEVSRDSIEFIADFAARTGGHDSGFHRTGMLYLHPETDADEVRSAVPALQQIGVDIRLLSHDEMAREFPQVVIDGVAVAAFEENAGYADPAMTTTGMLAAARANGAEVRANTRVETIEALSGGGARLRLARGELELTCDRLLIAAGPWSGPLARQVGVELPLTVERHIVATVAWGRAPRMTFGHADVGAGYYCKLEGSELFCLGWLEPAEQVDADEFERRITRVEEEELLRAAARRVPSLEEAEPRGGWASLYDVSPDWQPVIGEIGDRIFIDAGTSGHGFKLAPMMGRHVADLVQGRPDPRLEQFHPRRFGEGELLAAGFGAARILG